MLVLCKIVVTIMLGEIPFINSFDVEGKILAESNSQYVVDFSKGLNNFNLASKPSNYSRVLVDRNKCVKIK